MNPRRRIITLILVGLLFLFRSTGLTEELSPARVVEKLDSLKDTIASGLNLGVLAYVGKASDGTYNPFIYKQSLPAAQIDISNDAFIISKELAERYIANGVTAAAPAHPTGLAPSAGLISPNPTANTRGP